LPVSEGDQRPGKGQWFQQRPEVRDLVGFRCVVRELVYQDRIYK